MENKQEVQDYFINKKTEWYLEDNKLPLFIDSMPRNPKILDIGCGNGILVQKLSELGFKDIHMADIDNYLSGDAERLGVFKKVDLTYEKLPYFDGEFDVVFATMVLEHLENPWHWRIITPHF